jgi:hypothetical protein
MKKDMTLVWYSIFLFQRLLKHGDRFFMALPN